MSNRGRGNCPRCSEGYSNRAKPPSCPKCGYELGGKFQPKKVKSNSAPIVEVCHGLFSCRTTGRDDRCFVTNRDGIWLCTREDCKLSRSIHVNTGLLKEYQCEHIKLAKNYPNASPLRVFTPVLDAYPCSDSIRLELSGIIESLPSNTPSVVQVSEQTFAVFGPATASNPLGFCHVKMNQKVKIGYACSGKDCSGNAAKAKGFSVRSCCLHLHLLLAALRQSTHLAFSDSVPPSTTSCESSSACLSTPVPQQSLSLSSATSAPGLTTCSATTSLTSSTLLSSLSSSTSTSASTSANASNSIQRQSTVLLAEKVRKLPYKIPRELLRGIMARDSCSLLGLSGGWPTVFLPVDEYCGLCHSPLGRETNHPGQQSNDAYLITELNAFSKVDVKVKTCSSKDCLAIHQPFPVDIGLFNVCDKVFISLDIMLEFRQLFKRGHPILNVIISKLSVLSKKCREENCPKDSQVSYIKDLLYSGFYCFEMIAERSLDDVVCGICGICPEICLGDGNEKNCCTNSQIHYTKKDEPQKSMISLPEFLRKLRLRWLERCVYTRVNEQFSVALEEIPPLMPASLSNDVLVNTEADKKSVYLQSGVKPTGDPAMLHKLIVDGSIEMEKLQDYSHEELVKFCSTCKVPTSGFSKQFLCGVLQQLYASILVGNCPCHSFGKLSGHTGGFYHVVCRHGSTVVSKFLTLTESVRDAADLYLSLKHPPVVFINDTPCGFVRHMECRDPDTAKQLWGSTSGCFEKPTLGKDPDWNQNFPCLVAMEYSDGTYRRKEPANGLAHPLLDTDRHFVLGD